MGAPVPGVLARRAEPRTAVQSGGDRRHGPPAAQEAPQAYGDRAARGHGCRFDGPMRRAHHSLGGLLLPAVLGAALVAGCGSSGPATAAPAGSSASGAPGASAPGASAGPAASRPAGAYSVILPKGWRSVRIGSNYATIAAAYNPVNLRFATSLASQLLALPK